MKWTKLALLPVTAALAGARWRCTADTRIADETWLSLVAAAEAAPERYDPAMIAGLPAIAHRYFEFAITPGAPLHRLVRIAMSGEFDLNGRALPMRAEQVLAPPTGLVWRAWIGRGMLRIDGSDGYLAGATSWTRFWLHGLVPLTRVADTPDHARSAAARMALESVWCPAALLPQAGAVWRQAAPDVAEIEFPAVPGIEPIRLVLDADGRPVELVTQRWSNANALRHHRLQAFGGRVLQHREWQGFRVPSEVEIGNGYGRSDYRPFFRARIDSLRYGPD